SIGEVKTKESYKLNERHYGKLQGRTHEEVEAEVGKDMVHTWRRSYDVRPPELDITDPRFPGNDPKYKDVLKFELPLSESLKDTEERVVEYFEDEISTFLRVDENVLVVASGNTLRSLVKYLEGLSAEDITKVEISTGEIIVYEMDDKLMILKKTTYNVK
ncbi:MAG TPA: phosphoglyceromutase, partial [Firmicutes bacterium]|nr:phosphoglyceromutase [Bacillota bacterium]